MKNIFRFLIASSFIIAAAASCKKDEVKDYFEGGTPPVLSAATNASSSDIALDYYKSSEEAVTFSWTNPNYQFTTGISSHDVSYLVELDTAGASFTNPKRQSISVSTDLSLVLTQGQLNDYLVNQLQLVDSVPHTMEVRVTASLVNNAGALPSNVLQFIVVPFRTPPKVTPPYTGQLFLVGDATYGGWNNPVPVPSQEFTKISDTYYEIIVPLYGGGKHYLMLPENGNWAHKYAVKDQNIPGLGNSGGDFFYDASQDIPGPDADGTYKIEADFQRGKFIVTKQ